MNLVDLAVLGIVFISAILGLSRGFVREMLGVGSWAAAAYGALRFGHLLVPTATQALGSPDVAGIAAYAVTFIGLLIIMSLLANLIGRMVRLSALGGLDRTLGLLFGILRGDAVVVAAYALAGFALHPPPWPAPFDRARTLGILHSEAVWAASEMPEQYRPVIPPPPAAPETNAADLLHVNPEGRALGPRPAPH